MDPIGKTGLSLPLVNPSAGANPAGAAGSAAGAARGFGDTLREALEAVNRSQTDSDHLATEFQLGNPDVSVEQVMIAVNRANLAFQAAIQVRNRLVSAYNEVMNLQV